MVSIESNLASNSYTFSDVEQVVSGEYDNYLMLKFNAEVCIQTTTKIFFCI